MMNNLRDNHKNLTFKKAFLSNAFMINGGMAINKKNI